jgi:hypothetical protein
LLTLKYWFQQPAPVIVVSLLIFAVVAIEMVMVLAPVFIDVISAVGYKLFY